LTFETKKCALEKSIVIDGKLHPFSAFMVVFVGSK